MENVILVNTDDVETGIMEKMEAHRQGLLHRAFSVFIFNDRKELLLQQRDKGKYHSAGLWTNTCCSHPRPGESILEAAQRRLREEMGFTAPLNFVTSFIYKAELENGLTEHELDHVLEGTYNESITPNPEEAMDWKYESMETIEKNMLANPESYTVWFRIIFPQVKDFILSRK